MDTTPPPNTPTADDPKGSTRDELDKMLKRQARWLLYTAIVFGIGVTAWVVFMLVQMANFSQRVKLMP